MTRFQFIRIWAHRYLEIYAAQERARAALDQPTPFRIVKLRRLATLYRLKTLLFALRGKWRAAAKAWESWFYFQSRVDDWEWAAMNANGGAW